MNYKTLKVMPALILLLLINNAYSADLMTQNKLESVITDMADAAKGDKGLVKFSYEGVSLAVISDVRHDRMRVISPIKSYIDVSAKQIDAMMEANFHSALDARYALSDGVLYAAFIHPLSSLSKANIQSAVRQVAALVKSFGTTYSSGALNFGGKRKNKPLSGT